ncbi:MAG: hypothetical protein LBN05_00750 [Oscillospiraceae bacterium]|jgi:magnesium-transporting ATPase (P-type)|nr:hypothetical protein [Oscillospiraceae bacterium]
MNVIIKAFLDSIKKDGILKWLQENLKVFAAIGTVILAILTAGGKFALYLLEYGKTTYWGLSAQAITTITDNVWMEFILSLLVGLVLSLVSYSPSLIKKYYKNKYKAILIFLPIVVAVVLFLLAFLSTTLREVFWESWQLHPVVPISVYVLLSLAIAGILLSPGYIRLILVRIVKKCKKKKEKPIKEPSWGGILVYFAVCFIVLLGSFFASGYVPAKLQKTFHLIDTYAIIYESSDKYYLAQYTINPDDTLVIDLQHQKVTDKSGTIEYEVRTFARVEKK